MKTKTPPKMTEQKLIALRDELLNNKAQQEKLKEREYEIRDIIVGSFYPADKEEGSKTVTEFGVKMELAKVLNYSIGKDDAEAFFESHPKIAAECIGWSPKVKPKGYHAHTKELAKFVTITPGRSTVTFK